MSMNAEIKDNWVAALVSGDYKQGKGYLHSGANFCCLGVLTDLYIKAHPEGHGWEAQPQGPVSSFGPYENSLNSVLPHKVKKWAGLESESPEIGGRQLIDLNDADSLGFTAIAQIIKESEL